MKSSPFQRFYAPGLYAYLSEIGLPLNSTVGSDYRNLAIQCGRHIRSISYETLILMSEDEMLDKVRELAFDIKWTIATYEA